MSWFDKKEEIKTDSNENIELNERIKLYDSNNKKINDLVSLWNTKASELSKNINLPDNKYRVRKIPEKQYFICEKAFVNKNFIKSYIFDDIHVYHNSNITIINMYIDSQNILLERLTTETPKPFIDWEIMNTYTFQYEKDAIEWVKQYLKAPTVTEITDDGIPVAQG